MKMAVEFIKRYLVEGLCAVGAIVGILLIVFGLGRLKNVQTELDEAMRVKDDITRMANGQVINQRGVDQAARRIADIRAGFDEVMAFVKEHNAYPPLTAEVFPGGTRNDINNRIAFRNAFRQLRDKWNEQLHAGHEPTTAEIQAEKDRMEARSKPDAAQPNNAPAQDLTPEMGAALLNAQRSYCYATADSFQDSAVSDPAGPMYGDNREPPTHEEIWQAQLEAWVQQSVVDAIATINDRAAAKLEANQEAPWVGNLPCKDLRSLQTTRYYVKEGLQHESDKSAKERVYPAEAPADAFTGRQSNDLYELMRFTVQMVVDARDVAEVVAELTDGRFHVPLRVEYEAIEPNVDLKGKIYGDAPVVLMTAHFETVFFSHLYLPLMPDDILKELGKQRPEPETTSGT